VTAIPDVEGLRSLVEIVDNLNMAIQYIAAEREFTDAVIEPHQTRLLLRAVLRLLRDK
jgi:acetyl-CoA carboxylase carboxyltransferase component